MSDVQTISDAIRSIERDAQLLDLMASIRKEHAAALDRLHAENAELRDGLLALSNRIEAVTRAQVGSGLHSVMKS